jgi:hypothetical protein
LFGSLLISTDPSKTQHEADEVQYLTFVDAVRREEGRATNHNLGAVTPGLSITIDNYSELITTTSSRVIMDQLEKIRNELPVKVRLERRNKYFTFS